MAVSRIVYKKLQQQGAHRAAQQHLQCQALGCHQPPGQLMSSLAAPFATTQQLNAPACSIQLQFSSVEKTKILAGVVPLSHF